MKSKIETIIEQNSKLLVSIALALIACVGIVAIGVHIYRTTNQAQALRCDVECEPGGDGGIERDPNPGGTGTTTQPPSGGGAPPASGMTITFDRPCDTIINGFCAFNMSVNDELIVHEFLANYTFPYSNAPGWPISGLTDWTGPQGSPGYNFTVAHQSGGDFTCKPSPGTAQFPSVYGTYTCLKDFRGTTTPASGSTDYYLKIGPNTQNGDYRFQVINVKGIDTWGADFFTFYVHVGPTAVPDFTLSCDTNNKVVTAGTGTTFSVSASNAIDGAVAPVSVTLDSVSPSTGTITAGAGSIATIPGSVLMSVNTTSATPPSPPDYTLTFKAVSSGPTPVTKYCTSTLTVNPVTYNLNITKSGTGSGTVTSSPGSINCGTTCNTSYTQGTSVTLTASPSAGSTFIGWSGSGCSGTGSCTVTMNSNQTVNAQFDAVIPDYTLSVTKSGTGSGTVTSNIGSINCGSTCSSNYPDGTSVTLTVSPAAGSMWVTWGGSCSGNATSCTVVMNQSRTVTAQFDDIPVYNLNVNKTGTGSGTVTSNPAGISCGSGCSASYLSGTSVTLTASPSAGSTFIGWSGSGCSGTGNCVVTMTTNRSVSAQFDAVIPNYTLSVSKNGSGNGTVVSNDSSINCGATCNATYPSGTTLTLTAAPLAGSTFIGWSGSGCSGTGNCVVTMTANRSVSAQFDVIPNYTLTVTKSGTGSGTVTSSPGSINCGTTCNTSYTQGTSVTLTASPSAGSTFIGWSGSGCSGTGSCTVTMNSNQTVNAQFDAVIPADFILTCVTNNRVVTAGGATSYTISASNAVGGATGPITVTLDGTNPSTSTITSSAPGTINAIPGSTLVGVQTTPAVPPSPPDYTLSFKGVSSGASPVTKYCTSTLTVNPIIIPPGQPSVSVSNATCGKISVSWSRPSGPVPDGYRVYRSASNSPYNWVQLGANIPDTGAGPYSVTDNSPLNLSSLNYYSVIAYIGAVDGPRGLATPITPIPCQVNLSETNKDITKVNNTSVISGSSACDGAPDQISLPNNALIKAGDTVTFRIELCNTGATATATLTGASISDTLINVKNPSGFTFTNGCNNGSVSLGTDASGNTTFSVGIDDLAPGAICTVTFNAVVTAPANPTETLYRFLNRGTLFGTDSYSGQPKTQNFSTPPYLFTLSAGSPRREEVAP